MRVWFSVGDTDSDQRASRGKSDDKYTQSPIDDNQGPRKGRNAELMERCCCGILVPTRTPPPPLPKETLLIFISYYIVAAKALCHVNTTGAYLLAKLLEPFPRATGLL